MRDFCREPPYPTGNGPRRAGPRQSVSGEAVLEGSFGIVIVLGVICALFCVVARLNRGGADDLPPERPDPSPSDEIRPSAPWVTPRPEAVPSPPLAVPPAAFPPEALSGKAWVVDGDTLKIRNRPLRLFGIDAPEMDHPYGVTAQRALRRLCNGHEIRASIVGCDEYGREVAKCHLPDGRDLSAEMVKLGLAIDWPKFSGGLYTDMEVPGARKKLWLADARQKGRMHVWQKYAADQARKATDRAKG